MNPDYYKTKHSNIYKHEMDRVKSMLDEELDTRYGKMTKKDKIGAFYEALTDADRSPKLRKKMEGNHGIKAPSKKKESYMKFVKVLNNDDDGDGNVDKKALFHFEDKYYLYSFVCNNLGDGACTLNETMTFLSNSEGEIVDAREIYSGFGYIHSTDAMNNTVAYLELIEEESNL
jgi:hypothetical protein